MLNVLGGKTRESVSGKVERVGATGFKGDVFYMTLLLQGSNRIYTVFFDANDHKNNAASLTQPGDEVEFFISDANYGFIKIKDFLNKTIDTRLRQQETAVVKVF